MQKSDPVWPYDQNDDYDWQYFCRCSCVFVCLFLGVCVLDFGTVCAWLRELHVTCLVLVPTGTKAGVTMWQGASVPLRHPLWGRWYVREITNAQILTHHFFELASPKYGSKVRYLQFLRYQFCLDIRIHWIFLDVFFNYWTVLFARSCPIQRTRIIF